MSNYLVLGRDESGHWREVRTVDSGSSLVAVRKVADSTDGQGYSVFIAVPERSWHPLKVERKQVVQTRLAPASAKEAPDDRN